MCCLFAKVSVLLNIAAVHMEQGEYAAACSSCSAALVLDPENLKGLVRRAQCYIAKHEHKVSSPHSPDTNPRFWLQSFQVLEVLQNPHKYLQLSCTDKAQGDDTYGMESVLPVCFLVRAHAMESESESCRCVFSRAQKRRVQLVVFRL